MKRAGKQRSPFSEHNGNLFEGDETFMPSSKVTGRTELKGSKGRALIWQQGSIKNASFLPPGEENLSPKTLEEGGKEVFFLL